MRSATLRAKMLTHKQLRAKALGRAEVEAEFDELAEEYSQRSTIVLPSVGEDKAITEAARSDPDALPITPKQLKAMVPMRAVRGRRK